MGLFEILKSLFGKGYLNKIIGTRTNVAKPIRMDKNSPFKEYSDAAFDDPKVLSYIEKKINEYGPYALSNKNASELANFEANAKRLLEAKNKQTGTTPGMAQQIAESMFGPLGKKAKPEAEIVDIRTQQKVKPQGIETLKSEIGLPEGVEPGSVADKAIKESAEYKMNQQGVKSLLDENYNAPKTTSIDEDEIADINLKEDIAKLTDREARAYSANIESYRRPIIREMLLKDTKIKLPDDVRKSLENKDDLQRGADPEMDPLRLLNEYYDVDFNKLDELEEIRFTARNETEAADEFLKKGGLEPKKDLGDKLKDYDGDPDGLAEGGRIGFAGGGIKALLAMMNKKFGKGTMKTADEVKASEFKAFKTERDFDAIAEKLNLEKDFKAFNERTDNSISKAMDEVGGNFTGDMKYDADVLADEIAFQRGLIPEGGDLTDIADQMKRMDIYDEAYSAVSKQFLKNREIKKAKLSYADKDKRMIPEGLTEEGIDLSILKGEFERKYSKLIPEDLMRTIMADENPQRVKEIIAHVEQAAIMTDKGMSADQVIDAFKKGEKRKDNADGGLNYLMGL